MDHSPEQTKTKERSPALPLLPLLDSRRERADAARNRDAILCAAQRLVSDRGADGVTMDEVACAAGVGKGTLFRRFGDRTGLIDALLDDAIAASTSSGFRLGLGRCCTAPSRRGLLTHLRANALTGQLPLALAADQRRERCAGVARGFSVNANL